MRLTLPILFLVLANLLPIAGVVFLGWSVLSIMLLFWLENIIVGLLNIPRIIFALGGDKASNSSIFQRIFTAAFFTFHYGMFTVVHGMFVFNMFGGDQYDDPTIELVWSLITEQHLYWAMLALFVSHFISLLMNYFMSGEYKKVTTKEMMKKPYGRIVVLHLGIIFGGIVLDILAAPLAGLVILLLIKIVFDVQSHVREHKGLQTVTTGQTGNL